MNPESLPNNVFIFNEDTSYDTPQNTPQDTPQDTLQDTSQDIPQDTSIKKQRSAIHDYFTIDKENNKYKCNNCSKSYKISNDGSTSSLWKHVKGTHNDLLQITDGMNRLEISEQLVCILIYLFILYNKSLN